MKFSEAYVQMRDHGKKIKLPEWKGYWIREGNTIMIHLASGQTMDLRNTQDTFYTFDFVARENWMVI